MQVDFTEPMEFEFGPEGPIKVGGGFNLQEADKFTDVGEVSPDGLVNGKVPEEFLPNRVSLIYFFHGVRLFESIMVFLIFFMVISKVRFQNKRVFFQTE